MIAKSNERAAPNNQSTRCPNAEKPYRKPTLVKGPMLSVIAADTSVSTARFI
jgi:hypothetical protein